MKEKDAALERKDHELSVKDTTLGDLRHKLRETNDKLKVKDTILEEKEKEIGAMKRELDEERSRRRCILELAK